MKCRCCRQEILCDPLLIYKDMPKAAQYFPTTDNVAMEAGCNLSVYQCPYCGTIQLSGEPVPYYREVIRATSVSPAMRDFRLKQFCDWLKRYQLHNKRIIEIGCGGGEFISMMQEAGGDVSGIEFSTELVEKARAFGFKVWNMAIENKNSIIPQSPYDAFYIMSFLEHNPDPSEFLQGIRNNLKDGGVGIVEVPNADIILKNGLYAEFIQDHLLYFTQDTLCRLLECNGFEVLSCQSIWYDYVLCAEVRKRTLYDVSVFYQRKLQVENSLNEFFGLVNNRGLLLAAWGAGHQALANLSLLQMSSHIKFVLDSAPFKQGKFTPASHIPIISPEEINRRNIGAVLVMAGSYSAEILSILRQKYPDVLRAVLDSDGVKMDC